MMRSYGSPKPIDDVIRAAANHACGVKRWGWRPTPKTLSHLDGRIC